MEMAHHLVYAAAASWVHGRTRGRMDSRFFGRRASLLDAAMALLFGGLFSTAFLLQSGPLPEKARSPSEPEKKTKTKTKARTKTKQEAPSA